MVRVPVVAIPGDRPISTALRREIRDFTIQSLSTFNLKWYTLQLRGSQLE
jgi:hypothetical protein